MHWKCKPLTAQAVDISKQRVQSAAESRKDSHGNANNGGRVTARKTSGKHRHNRIQGNHTLHISKYSDVRLLDAVQKSNGSS